MLSASAFFSVRGEVSGAKQSRNAIERIQQSPRGIVEGWMDAMRLFLRVLLRLVVANRIDCLAQDGRGTFGLLQTRISYRNYILLTDLQFAKARGSASLPWTSGVLLSFHSISQTTLDLDFIYGDT